MHQYANRELRVASPLACFVVLFSNPSRSYFIFSSSSPFIWFDFSAVFLFYFRFDILFFFRASPRLYRVTGALSRDLPPFSFDFIRFYVVIVFFRGRFFVDVAVAVAVVLHISADYVSLGSFYCGLECFFSRRRNRLSAKNKTKQNKKTSVVPFRNIR